MIFVTADSNRARLDSLTQLLVLTFPGSTIYQHANPLRASGDVFAHRVDGVFLAAEMDGTSGIELLQMLRKQKKDIPVYILSETEVLREAAMDAGASGYFLRPVSEQDLKDAVLPE